MTVLPSSVAVAIGDTVRLSATMSDPLGVVLPLQSVSWTTSSQAVAAVGASGLVLGVGVGSALITAESGGKTATASVVVSAPQSAAVDTLFQDGFESGNLTAWDDKLETQAGNYSVLQDPSLAFAGSRVLRVRFPQGVNGGAGALTKFAQPGARIYARIRLRLAPSWSGGVKFMLVRGSPTQWGSFGVSGVCPNGSDFVLANAIAHITGNPGPLRLYTYFPGMVPSGSVCWGNHGIASEDPSPGPTPLASYLDLNRVLTVNAWHTLELEAQLNAIGASDGWQRLWADGTLVAEWTGMRWRTSAQVVWQGFTLDNSSSPKSPGTELYVDDVLVTNARP